jgi:hypothetical protein
MRPKLKAPTIASLALIGAGMTAGTATAAAAHGATQTAVATKAVSAASAVSAACVYAEAQESVKIRNSKKVNSTALGLFPKGKTACKVGATEEGGSYDLCGHKGKTWMKISYRGIRGWIPYYCGARDLG